MIIAASAASAVLALMALVTSVDLLRTSALLSLLVPGALIIRSALWWRHQPALGKPLLYGLIACGAAGILVLISHTVYGFGLGYERKLSELPQPRVRLVEAEARRDPSAETILALVKAAREQPSAATFRPLLPFMHSSHTTVIMPDGSERRSNTVVREVLQANSRAFQRSLHAEALAMAALLPVEGPAPAEIIVDAPERLRLALGALLEAHSEQRMSRRFDLPSVGIVLPVIHIDAEQGARELRHQVGMTFPFGSVAARDDVEVSYPLVTELLEMIRAELGY
ncbi:MAG: hypothetical protein EA402_14385 [Planctomycetota bacterium]|nr:MAG: hypothetical protein EA402_14385 [Planctomycetota bacterium]